MGKSRRLKLQQVLVDILGSSNVYFQPPSSVTLSYPCIVYQRTSGDTQFADDIAYHYEQAYDITFISKDPDTDMVDSLIRAFPKSRYDRNFISDNLNHDVIVIYY